MAEYICPHCKNPVYDDEALLCLYCGESLRRPGKFFVKRKPLFIALVLLVLIAVLFVFLR